MSATWVKVARLDTPLLIYGCLYQPPRACEETALNYLSKTLATILVKYLAHYCSIINSVFGLSNIVSFLTRNDSYLDKIFTNGVSYIDANCKKFAPLGKSDQARQNITSWCVTSMRETVQLGVSESRMIATLPGKRQSFKNFVVLKIRRIGTATDVHLSQDL